MRLNGMAFGTLLSLAGLLSACGSDTAGSQSKEPLRLTAALAQAYVGEAYNAVITAEGGIRPYKYTFDGNLPKGLTYADGRVTGTPQEKGTFDLNVTVEDGNLSSKSQKVTLTVGETPPPQLEQVYPMAEAADPFTYLLRVRNREAKGFQMQVSLKDMKPALDSLKTGEGLLAVTRYNPETRLLDVDAVYVTPKKDAEMLRLNITPDKKLRANFANGTNPLLAFYDKTGALIANTPQIDRVKSEGRYKFSDLQAIANNWGKKTAPAPQGQAPAQPASAKAPETPAQTGQAAPANGQTPAAQTPAQPQTQQAQPTNQQAQPTNQQGQSQNGAQPTEQQAAPGQANAQPQGTAPTEQTPAPTNGQAAPGQTVAQPRAQGLQAAQPQPTNADQPQQKQDAQALKPATPTPTQPQNVQAQQPPAQAQKLEGDLNGDGVVDQKDLDLLRSSYAWASLVGVKQPAPADPTPNPQNPNNQNRQPGQNPQNTPAPPPSNNPGGSNP